MPGSPQPRVLIVDDHEMVAQGLAELLQSDASITVVGRAGTATDALRLVAQEEPDVVVMDYRLPDGDGASTAVAIRARHAGTAVLMVTASDHQAVVAEALEAGCGGFVSKDRSADEVVRAVLAVASGELFYPPALLARMVPQVRRGRGVVAISPREHEVLRLLSEGASTDAIAAELFVSPNTVRNHVQNILRKLGVHSKLAAVAVGIRQGLIRPGA